ncbi:hypothetical protein [Tautonia sociabilis]|uniref:Uncharacterized protein n=1 Tax=Tautonia sociabilis TaxID=2080755 RepID=A0A432MPI2_9BACT|nr:hypothetical protein [Tautonia sociabilis]RUL89361.1 hypothetical protein TsocGM_02835 [Tautonia sociabilis]
MPLDEPDGDRKPTLRLHLSAAGPEVSPRGVSGSRFVLGAVLVLLGCWGAISLAFDAWRAGVRERIAYGMDQVVPVLRPMADVSPPGLDPPGWREAVDASEEMLREVVGTGRLDRSRLDALRLDLSRRVDRAARSPESAPTILASIWDEMARITLLRPETKRPGILPPPRRIARPPANPSDRVP